MGRENLAVAGIVVRRVAEVRGDRLLLADGIESRHEVVREVVAEAPAVAVGRASEEEAGSAATVEGVAPHDSAASVVDEEGVEVEVKPIAGQAGCVGHECSVGAVLPPAISGGRRVLDDQGATNGVEGVHDWRQMRAVVRVDEPLDGFFAGAKAVAEFGAADTLLTHGRVQGKFGRDKRGNGDEMLPRLGGTGGGDFLTLPHMRREDRNQGILGHRQGFLLVRTTSEGSPDIGKGHIEPARVFGMQVAWIGVSHWLPLLPIDPQVSQHYREQPAAYL